MAHAWKACWVKALGGSNPPSSAVGTTHHIVGTGEEFAFQSTAAVYEQCLVAGVLADAHGLIIRKIDYRPLQNLIRTRRCGPLAALPVWFAVILTFQE